MQRQNQPEASISDSRRRHIADELAPLRTAPLFRELPEPQLLALATAAQRQVYSLGELVIEPDGDHLVVIVIRGGVRISLLSPEGRELTLSRRSVGNLFQFGGIEASLPGEAIVQAVEDETILYFLPCARFLTLACIDPRSLTALTIVLREELARSMQLIHALAFSSVRRRLAHLLAELAEPGERPVVQRTRADLASLLGTRAEEVTKALRSLMDKGLVEYPSHGRTITLLDRERLCRY